MTLVTNQIDLDHVGLKPGGGLREEFLVEATGFSFSGQGYRPTQSPLAVKVDISQTNTGFVLRVRFSATVEGPCMRCFDGVPFAVDVDHTEVHEPSVADELASEYVTGDIFDLAGFVHEAIGLALPSTMSGRLMPNGSCGLCSRTAADLAELGISSDAEPTGGDPRWAKLSELELGED